MSRAADRERIVGLAGLDSGVPGGLLVVCPAYNEAAAIAGVVAEIRHAVPGSQVVVVDDGSTDATAEVARAAGARVLQFPFNIGVGAAVRAGLLLGAREGAAAVIQCDADGQHPPAAIAALAAALADADLVIAARWAGIGHYTARGPRRWAMTLLARVLSAVHGVRLDDVTSGFRAFGPRAIEVLSRELPPEYLGDTVDALVIARAHGLRVAQVPVEFRPRCTGTPSQGPLRSGLYLARAVLVLTLSLLRLAGRRGHHVRPVTAGTVTAGTVTAGTVTAGTVTAGTVTAGTAATSGIAVPSGAVTSRTVTSRTVTSRTVTSRTVGTPR